MPFVKLDQGIIRSSLWPVRDDRSVFITSLVMAEPFELTEATRALNVRDLKESGFVVPPGWYGLVSSAGVGIINADGLDKSKGLQVLDRLCSPDPESRSQAFDGRRMARIDGGYLILNYFAYRDKDFDAAERMRRLRDRRKGLMDIDVTANSDGVTPNVLRKQSTEGRVQRQRTTKDTDSPRVVKLAECLRTPAFRQAWADWAKHRRTKRCPLNFNTATKQLKKCEEWGEKKSVASIEMSIMQGYQGLIEDRNFGKTTANGGGKIADANAALANKFKGGK